MLKSEVGFETFRYAFGATFCSHYNGQGKEGVRLSLFFAVCGGILLLLLLSLTLFILLGDLLTIKGRLGLSEDPEVIFNLLGDLEEVLNVYFLEDPSLKLS